MCSITGYSSSTQDPIGGGVGTQRSSMGFTLYYVGGVPIGSCEFDQDSEACDSLYYKGTTIPASMLNSASDIQWTPDAGLFGFGGCSIKYEGVEYQGILNADWSDPDNCPTGWGDTCYYCTVDFQCEGNL